MPTSIKSLTGFLLALATLAGAVSSIMKELRELRSEQAALYENAAYSFSEDGAEAERLRVRIEALEKKLAGGSQ